jgi:hypothetical protein
MLKTVSYQCLMKVLVHGGAVLEDEEDVPVGKRTLLQGELQDDLKRCHKLRGGTSDGGIALNPAFKFAAERVPLSHASSWGFGT